MKGIILAGGTGSRLWPLTRSVSKQLLPVYDKPLIFYPLSTLMLGGIRDILIITTPSDQYSFKKLLGTGDSLGISIKYMEQPEPEGLAQAFIIGEEFIASEKVCLILGDNIFHGQGLGRQLNELTEITGAQIFGIEVADPAKYGVAELDSDNRVISIEEKPQKPKSSLAIPGIYFFDNSVCGKARKVKKSPRGELEITSLLDMYRHEGNLVLKELTLGTIWMDCGSPESLNEASNYIRAIETRQNHKVGCLEEISWRNGWISTTDLIEIALKYGASTYANYLRKLVANE